MRQNNPHRGNDSRRDKRFDRAARPERPAPVEEEEDECRLEGRNAVTEALKAGRTIDKVFIADGDTDKGLQRLAAMAKEAGAVVVPVDRRKLDLMSTTRAHQGIIAQAAAHEYATIDDILEEAASRGQAPLLVICDELSDPPQSGRHHPYRRVRRCPWRHHSQAAQRGPDGYGCKGFRRRDGVYEGCPGRQHQQRHP